MSAAMVPCVELTCDAPGCCDIFRVETDSFAETRQWASREGWTHDPVDKLDFCPAHRTPEPPKETR